jgi:hypothetical protein
VHFARTTRFKVFEKEYYAKQLVAIDTTERLSEGIKEENVFLVVNKYLPLKFEF